MFPFNSLKKYALLASVLLSSSISAEQVLGLVGGHDSSGSAPAYAASILPDGIAAPLLLNLPTGSIESVALNAFGQGIIGGSFSPVAYAAILSPTGAVTPITLGIPNGEIKGVAINDSKQGLIGGRNVTALAAYAATISPSGIATQISLSGLNGTIYSVALNASSEGIIGGQSASGALPAYAALISPSGVATPIALTNISTTGTIVTVAINNAGQGIVGGIDSDAAPGYIYAASVSPTGTATPLFANQSLTGAINSVAINTSGQAIIGGLQGSFSQLPYVSFVSPSGTIMPIAISIPSTGTIYSVDLNDSGYAIIGGEAVGFGGPMYAALISPAGVETPLNLSIPNGVINSVAINAFGQGLIGGSIGGLGVGPAYAAIISPSGIVTPINLGLSNADLFSVAILSQIPTSTLDGNNLIFANYINQNAPQDAFYFAPAFFDGTLAQALESAAPTRNAISLYTTSNNLYMLTTTLSTHLRNQNSVRNKRLRGSSLAVDLKAEDQLLASLSLPEQRSDELAVSPSRRRNKTQQMPIAKKRPYSLWFDAIGALAYQKAQRQTPAFQPTTGGGILAFDAQVTKSTRVGGGVSYLFTHIHEKHAAGHSNINQEDLFVYASWAHRCFYLDGALFGGPFQIKQTRDIHMTGFDFKSSSSPNGWQLLPHLELGYNHCRIYCRKDFRLALNPFAMVDWANAWQGSYREKGNSPFNSAQDAHYSSLLRIEAGLRVYETLFFDSWNLIFQEKGSYVNTQTFGTGKTQAFFVGSPSSFTVETLTSAQNLGVAQLAITLDPLKASYPVTTLFYQGEFGTQYQSHQANLEFAWTF